MADDAGAAEPRPNRARLGRGGIGGGRGRNLSGIGAQHDFSFACANGVDQLKWKGAPAASKQAATAHDYVVRARDLRLVSDPLERAQDHAFISEDPVSLRAGKKPAELVRALN
jgi:hypothetical protein